MSDCYLPLSGLDASTESEKFNSVLGTDAWLCSTTVLMAMLCRWANVLKKDGPERAFSVLQSLLDTTVPPKLLLPVMLALPEAPSAYPKPVHQATVLLSCDRHVINAKAIFEHLQARLESVTEALAGLLEAEGQPDKPKIVATTADAKARLARMREMLEASPQEPEDWE